MKEKILVTHAGRCETEKECACRIVRAARNDSRYDLLHSNKTRSESSLTVKSECAGTCFVSGTSPTVSHYRLFSLVAVNKMTSTRRELARAILPLVFERKK